eukprot:15436183-Alexandrium_andersonii.AAC.1
MRDDPPARPRGTSPSSGPSGRSRPHGDVRLLTDPNLDQVRYHSSPEDNAARTSKVDTATSGAEKERVQ